ncbi:MAG: hypothetical protein PHI28_11005 [Mangrovibacterium sp.]|nr:hypothetical protein [Mangrovibacterium sp.]
MITKSLSLRLFGTDDPVGKPVKINETLRYTVGAVIGDINFRTVPALLGIAVLTGTMAGAYPALYLSVVMPKQIKTQLSVMLPSRLLTSPVGVIQDPLNGKARIILDVFGMRMIQGRFFSGSFSTDMESAVLINETALTKLGWDSAAGKQIGLISKKNRKTVVGVINDINVVSLQYPVKPMIYQFGPHHNYPGYIAVRLRPGNEAESLGFIKRQWGKLFPDIPFEFERVNEKYKADYGEEERLSKITGIFSILAAVLSALGVFALSTLQSEKRIKEIGICKVNGAKITEILAMLNQDLMKWIAVAFVIASQVAWYAMNKWLGNFAYKTGLSWWIFALAGLLALAIALLTVSRQRLLGMSKFQLIRKGYRFRVQVILSASRSTSFP